MKRRDFTINSIGYDYFTKEFLDPFDGLNDLKNRVLKHINDKTFVEDSYSYEGIETLVTDKCRETFVVRDKDC